jgi:nitrite reductase (cytochrome c-552)
MNPDQVYTFYNEYGGPNTAAIPGFEGKYADWVHPVSKTPSIKLQHPEFETWSSSTHGAAGVSCADCHMPYQRMEGKKKVSSHQWTSPLKTPQMIDNACRQCHTDKTAEYLRSRVEYTQDKTFENLLVAQELSVKAHEAVRQALAWSGSKNNDYDKLIVQAKEMIRKGQFYWDWVSAENSVGFHNPSLLLDTLFKSTEYSQKAINYAILATNYCIAPTLEGDITKILSPLLEWNRKKHMDQATKNRHLWTSQLPEVPQAELMWKGQEKIR